MLLVFGSFVKNFYQKRKTLSRIIIWIFALVIFLILFIVLFALWFWTFGAGAVTCFIFTIHIGVRNLPFVRNFKNKWWFNILELIGLTILTGAIVLCLLLIYDDKAQAVLWAFGFITFIVISYSTFKFVTIWNENYKAWKTQIIIKGSHMFPMFKFKWSNAGDGEMILDNKEGFYFFNIVAWLVFWGLLASALLE